MCQKLLPGFHLGVERDCIRILQGKEKVLTFVNLKFDQFFRVGGQRLLGHGPTAADGTHALLVRTRRINELRGVYKLKCGTEKRFCKTAVSDKNGTEFVRETYFVLRRFQKQKGKLENP
jgi:hypothetical protein